MPGDPPTCHPKQNGWSKASCFILRSICLLMDWSPPRTEPGISWCAYKRSFWSTCFLKRRAVAKRLEIAPSKLLAILTLKNINETWKMCSEAGQTRGGAKRRFRVISFCGCHFFLSFCVLSRSFAASNFSIKASGKLLLDLSVTSRHSAALF